MCDHFTRHTNYEYNRELLTTNYEYNRELLTTNYEYNRELEVDIELAYLYVYQNKFGI